MTVLTDTHSFLWYSWDDTRLSPAMTALLDDESIIAYISIISLWEITIKDTIGKLALGMPLTEFFDKFVTGNGFQILPLTQTHLAMVRTLPLYHRDPFDRILIAQSIVEGMPIITVDTAFVPYGVATIW